jgi:hypothetical protein
VGLFLFENHYSLSIFIAARAANQFVVGLAVDKHYLITTISIIEMALFVT